MAFNDRQLCLVFNQALTQLKSQGIYQEIIDKHHYRLGDYSLIKLD